MILIATAIIGVLAPWASYPHLWNSWGSLLLSFSSFPSWMSGMLS